MKAVIPTLISQFTFILIAGDSLVFLVQFLKQSFCCSFLHRTINTTKILHILGKRRWGKVRQVRYEFCGEA